MSGSTLLLDPHSSATQRPPAWRARAGRGSSLVAALVTAAAAVTTCTPAVPAWASLAAEDGGPGRAVALLSRSVQAAAARNYEGSQVVMLAGAPSAVFVSLRHWAGLGSRIRVTSPDGVTLREVFEPDAAAGEGRVDPSLLVGIGSHYDAEVTGMQTAAGRPADVVSLRRSDGSVAARFWIDRATGLTLRREAFDSSGHRLRTSAYLSITMDPSPIPARPATVAMPSAEGAELDPTAVDRLTHEGWLPATTLRGYTLLDARLTGSADSPILALCFTDGLSSLSLFEQSGRLQSGSLVGWERRRLSGHDVWVHAGMPTEIAWDGAGHVFTVVTDAVDDDVTAVVAALPHGPRHRSLWHRLHRGADRVASWFDPFH